MLGVFPAARVRARELLRMGDNRTALAAATRINAREIQLRGDRAGSPTMRSRSLAGSHWRSCATNDLISDEVLWSGTVDQSTIHCRELLGRALDLGASSLILVHNHPGGSPEPSRSDIAITQRVARAARTLGIAVLDHVIVAITGTASMRALGII